jgi:hypothetical protein
LSDGAVQAQRSGWQCHHLLPRALSRHQQLAQWLAEVEGVGPALSARRANILWLPATEAVAARTGMALHRGPHPAYNDVVAARLERIRVAAAGPAEARTRIARLQQALTATLSGQVPTMLRLNRHDPMRLFADYSSLDAAIATLIAPDSPDQPR